METTTKIEKLLKAADVAALLAISRTAAYRLLSSGELPAIRIGAGIIRVHPSDLQAFIDAQRGRHGRT